MPPPVRPLGWAARPACERRHDSGDRVVRTRDQRCARRCRPQLAPPGSLPGHRPRPVLPSRHHGRGTRPDRPGQGRLPHLPCHRPRASSSPWPPTRTPASGVAPPRRSGASCGGPSWPPEGRHRLLSTVDRHGQRLRPLRPRPGSPAPRPCPCLAAAPVAGRPRRDRSAWPPRSSMVPASSVVTRVRTIDRPRPVACSRSKPSGRPTPSSTTRRCTHHRRRWATATTT